MQRKVNNTNINTFDEARRPIRVLYATHANNLTGASRSLLDMLTGLPKGEVEPTVLLPQHGPLEKKLDELGVAHVVIPHIKWVNSDRGHYPDSIKRFVHRLAQPRINRYVRMGGFDIVHSNSLLCGAGMIAAQKEGIPYLSHMREMVEEDHRMRHIFPELSREVVRDAARVICISEVVGHKYRPWCSDGASVVINDAIDVESYRAVHAELFAGDTVEMLLAGRFFPLKGQLDAIKAAEILVNKGVSVHLVLVGGTGDESYRKTCEQYVENAGLSDAVKILDFHNDISALRAAADISLTCSANEAMGRVTAEGMMAGCLAIAANSGATPEIVEDGKTGLLYESGRPEALASCIESVITRKDECRQIALKGQAWACEHFDIHAYGKQLVALYREVLSETSAFQQ